MINWNEDGTPDLGPPVYKRDQIYTKEDLKGIINTLMADVAGETLSPIEAERFDAAINTLTSLYQRITENKRRD